MIESKLITDYDGAGEINEEIREQIGAPKDAQLAFMVFETTLDEEVYYTCLSGGEMKEGAITMDGIDSPDPSFTEVGAAALKTLINLPVGKVRLVLHGLRIGKKPLRDKVIDAIKAHPPGSRICFVGDFTEELDGKVTPILNFNGSTEIRA